MLPQFDQDSYLWIPQNITEQAVQKWVHTALELPSAARDPPAWLMPVSGL